LIGCGGFLVIGVVVVIAFAFWVRNKAAEIGLDPELMATQPALASAKMAVAINPDLEIVSVDEGKGLITFKEKSTGKVYTVSTKEAQDGKITIKDENGKGGSIQVKGDDSSGSIKIESDEGTTTFGSGGDSSLPDWLPAYPGARMEGVYSSKTNDVESAAFRLTTSDTAQEVIDFYEAAFRKAGMTVTKSKTEQGGKEFSQVIGADSSGNRSAFVNVASEYGGTEVTMTYSIKR
jgi:hypothetical protein